MFHPKTRLFNSSSNSNWVPFSFITNHLSFHNIVLNEIAINDVYLMFYVTQDTYDYGGSDDEDSTEEEVEVEEVEVEDSVS